MGRYLVGGLAALLLAGAGFVWFNGRANSASPLPAAPIQSATVSDDVEPAVPAAPDKTREEKRFGRYDKDRDGQITRDEYLTARRKAYAKLDTDHDGKLSFDEWAAKTTGKFAAADADKSGAMSAAEFATTAVKRTSRPRPCPPASES